MKIIELNFMNINSLKGEHRVSFEEVPLSDASIFAIVGPTGSGKSTILDVITLALFNRIPRFSKAISTKGITKESSVLTHHTKEAYASIEYEIKGKQYKSKWSIQTNRNDKLKDYEMTFYNPDGSVADLKKSEVPAQNEATIGLNYDQFVKAILLSQGEFSKFLKSDKNERGALLENLTGTSIYRKIGRKTFEKFKSVKEELEREQALLGEHQTLDKERITALTTELKTATQAKTKVDKSLVSLSELLQVKTSIRKLAEDLESKKVELSEVNKLVAAFQPDEQRVKTHEKISHLQASYTTYKNAKANVVQSKANVTNYQKELEDNKTQLLSTISEMATLTKQAVNQENFKKEMSAFEKIVNNLDKDLQHLKVSGIEARKRVNQDNEQYPVSIDDNIKPSDAITILEQRRKELSASISKSALDTKLSTAELKTSLKHLQQEVDQLKVLNLHYSEITKLETKLDQEATEIKTHENAINKYQPLIKKNEELLQSFVTHITLLRKQKEDAMKIAKLEELRESLVSGEACPLCGSIEHPYTSHLPQKEQSQIEQQIHEIEAKARTCQTECNEHVQIVEKSKTIVEEKQKVIAEAKNQLAKEKSASQTLLKTISSESKINADTISQVLDQKTSALIEGEQAIEAISEIEYNERLAKQYVELSKIGEQYKALHMQRQEKFTGPDVSEVANTLQDAFQAHLSNITRLQGVIATETESLKRDKNLVIDSMNQLEPKVKELGFSSIDEIENQLLSETTLLELNKQKSLINNRNIQVNTEIATLRKALDQKSKLDTDSAKSIDMLESTITEQRTLSEEQHKIAVTNQAILHRDTEDRKRLKDKQKKIDVLLKSLEKWSLLNQIIGDATGNKFANFAQGLTLKNLLVYANRRLEKLSDRYLLSKPEDDGALIVIDKYQGNTSRSVKTLSGGETFLISLALALSLSDMASKNVSLGCLFIDEGFGTLDPDTLELAMTTLETLQSESQKTVGVISHVETLKERISVQIQLDKNAQGLSSIKVVS